MKKIVRVIYIFSFFLFSSCMTMADYDFTEIDNSIVSGRYEDAYQTVESENSSLYSNNDEVLYFLDKGLLSHYAQAFDRSNNELSEAEKLILKNKTKSISQSVSSYLVNDNVVDYSGDTYEDIYTNIFMALNYLMLGKTEDAVVEIRRFDNKFKVASAQYADLIVQANNENKKKGGQHVKNPDLEFHNSALARYLSLILYRSIGKIDSAKIDYKYIQNAFELQPNLYDFAIPTSISEEFNVPKGMARLNIIAFSGKAPTKEEEVERLIDPDGDFYFKLALPIMKKQMSNIKSIEVIISPVDTVGEVSNVALQKIESIENIAIDTFEQTQALVYLKAIARSTMKSIGSSVFESLAEEDSRFAILHFASMLSNEFTERADVRSSRYFPANAWVTGVNLKPGKYNVEILYKTKSNGVLYKTATSVSVGLESLNLVESICLD